MSMSYFSLLTPENPDEDGDYCVLDAHINVWSLPGVLWHRPMVIDVGVMFKRAEDKPPLRSMPMVVPARVVKQINLSTELGSSATAQLIFGRRFESSDNKRLTLKGPGPVSLVSVDDKLDVDYHGDLTGVRVALGEVPSGLCYIRVRFVVDGGGTMWRWRRVAGRRDGALIDFRVHDPREGGANRRVQVDFDGRDKPIESLEAFFMLPDSFQLSGENPELEYTRTLEGRRWQEYLNRSPEGLIRRERILVHRWKRTGSLDAPAVSAQNPFRGYLQFNRRPAIRSVWDAILGGVVVAILLFALLRPLSLRSGPETVAEEMAHQVEGLAERVTGSLVALGLAAVILLALQFVPKVREWVGKVRRAKRAFKWLEFQYFAILKAIRPR